MTRPILKLKSPAPITPELPPLPPRPAKREQPLNQLLSFIVVDRKPYHHATYDDAAMERTYLQAVADRAPRKGRKQEFRVMKVLNLPGAQLQDKVVIFDQGQLDPAALDAARDIFEIESAQNEPGAEPLAAAIWKYLDALRGAQSCR